MTDIVERLRAYDNNGTASWLVPSKAADEIERLEKENESLKASVYWLYELEKELYECQAREAKLRDFAQWLTGCCDLTQYDYFIQNRHILAEQPDATALKEFKRKVLLEAAEFASTQGDIDFVVWQLRRMAEE